ncbi:MAG: hypothetical protein ACRC8G_09270 [Plesiomonas shigelloides]
MKMDRAVFAALMAKTFSMPALADEITTTCYNSDVESCLNQHIDVAVNGIEFYDGLDEFIGVATQPAHGWLIRNGYTFTTSAAGAVYTKGSHKMYPTYQFNRRGEQVICAVKVVSNDGYDKVDACK